MASISARAPCLVVASSSARTRVKRSSAGRSGATPATFTKSSSILTSSSTRNVRCQLSFDEGDDTTNKTLNSLDAILQGSQDEPKYDGPDTANEKANKEGERKPGQISDAMRKKLLGESVGLGGLPEKPSGGF